MTNTIYTLIAFLFVHFVADFVCQNDKMALGKSKSLYWLSVHAVTYFSVFMMGCFFIIPDVLAAKAIPFLLVNGAAHWITDFFTSRLNSYLLEKYKPSHHWFFVGIGFDQFIHAATILYTYQLFIL